MSKNFTQVERRGTTGPLACTKSISLFSATWRSSSTLTFVFCLPQVCYKHFSQRDASFSECVCSFWRACNQGETAFNMYTQTGCSGRFVMFFLPNCGLALGSMAATVAADQIMQHFKQDLLKPCERQEWTGFWVAGTDQTFCCWS